jgi:hypothetical protein
MKHAARAVASLAVSGLALSGMAVVLQGCGLDLGAGVARQLSDPHMVGSGHVAASTKLGSPFNSRGPLIGAELSGRAEQGRGARWTTGLRAGYGHSADPVPGSFGWEAFVDAGTRFGKGGLFPDGDYYLGGTAMGTFWISGRHQGADLNTSSWFFQRALELAPYASLRVHVDHPDGGDGEARPDLGLGLVLRLRMVSDYF